MTEDPHGLPPAETATLPVLRRANANFVTTRLAVGGDLSPNFRTARRQLDELVASGISHIVDLRQEWSDELLVRRWAPQVAYLHHSVADAGQQIEPEWFDVLVDWVEDAFADPATKVLVHCHMGVNRASSAALAILLDQGLALRPALDLIRKARPVASIDYAGSVLTWYFARIGAEPQVRHNQRRVLVRWRRAQHLDVEATIRAIRSREGRAARWAVRLGPKDPSTLTRVLAESGEVAVALTVDREPAELGQLDEVLFLTGEGLSGRALVVGPIEVVEDRRRLLPVMITEVFEPLPVRPTVTVRRWLAHAGPSPMLLSEHDYRALTSRVS